MADGDQALAQRMRRRDPGAFDEFFERFANPLLAYLEGMVRERAVAEDLLQETLLSVWRHLDRYEERGAFRAWVYRTATNAALSELRRRRYAATEPIAGVDHADPRCPDPAARHATAARVTAVEQAVDRLDDEHRTVLLLRVRNECSLREIAGILGIPEGTVKSRLHHAVRRVREWTEGRAERPQRSVTDELR